MRKFKQVICADGFSMSVQASETHYCSPRETGAERYTAVEIGYPSDGEPLLMYLAGTRKTMQYCLSICPRSTRRLGHCQARWHGLW